MMQKSPFTPKYTPDVSPVGEYLRFLFGFQSEHLNLPPQHPQTSGWELLMEKHYLDFKFDRLDLSPSPQDCVDFATYWKFVISLKTCYPHKQF